MHYTDHPPPHFHARYAGHKAIVEIRSLTLLEGRLPPRALGLVTEWAAKHTKKNYWTIGKGRAAISLFNPFHRWS